MVLEFDERVTRDLAFLNDLSAEYLLEFCKVALDFTINGGKPQVFARAASSMNLTAEVVSNGAAALSNVLIESAKNRLAKDKFLLSVADFPMPDGHKTALAEFYFEHRKAVSESLSHLSMTFPAYRKLDWRLDVELGSRTLHTKVEPTFMLRLDTANPDVSSTYLQASYANLARLVRALEFADAEVENSHSKRVVKFIR